MSDLDLAPPADGRRSFGPPPNGAGTFAWSALQAPRGLWWLLRDKELRSLALVPMVVTLAVGCVLAVGAVVLAVFVQGLLFEHHPGLFGTATWAVERVLAVLLGLLAAAFTAWQLQGALASQFMERIAIRVQRAVDGHAPPAPAGAADLLRRAARRLVPRVRDLLAWALSALVAVVFAFVPLIGPVLALFVQTAIAAIFLAHGAVAENRDRLGLPRWLLFREPAAVLGLAIGFVPLVLLPPLLLFSGAPVAVAGALVALGIRRRRGLERG